VGVIDSGLGLLERVRLAAFMPRLDIAVEGSARLCTSEHIGIYFAGAPAPPPGPVHIDVLLDMWNKGHQRVAVIEVRNAQATGQDLRDSTGFGSSRAGELTLEPGAPKTSHHFRLSPSVKDEPLAAHAGDRVTFRLRLGRNGRDRRVGLDIMERPG
jgi:hypothetical protein